MTDTHANLINNATKMQSNLLEFSHQMSNLSLKSLEDQVSFQVSEVIINASGSSTFTAGGPTQTYSQVKIAFGTTPVNVFVGIGDNGIPAYVSDSEMSGAGTPISTASTTPQQTVAISMAVVGMHLKGIGLTDANVKSIFENGITPTSLAAAESQLKGHHDAVLQLSLEALSRVTSVLQKISQKLSQ